MTLAFHQCKVTYQNIHWSYKKGCQTVWLYYIIIKKMNCAYRTSPYDRISFRSIRFVNTGSGSGYYFLHFTSYSMLIKRANSSAQNILILNYTSKLLVCYANCRFEYIIHNVSIRLKLITHMTNSKNAIPKCNTRNELYVRMP